LKISTTYTEEELVKALQNNDNEGYQYLYLHYRGALHNVILQIVNEEETANDILQEVFIAVCKNIDKYDAQKGRLFTWLHTLARNGAINKLRSKNYKANQKNENIDNYVFNVDVSNATNQNINAIGLRKQVHLLREDYKNVLELSYYKGFTQEEISKILKIPLGTVKTRLRNALIEIRKQFI
jgi:RNA polymerase sigma factor (sigma-70 family)